MNIKDTRRPAPRVVVWVFEESIEHMLEIMSILPAEWEAEVVKLATHLRDHPPALGTVHGLNHDEFIAAGWHPHYSTFNKKGYFGIVLNKLTNKHYHNLERFFPLTEVFYTAIGERVLDSEYSIWWLSEDEVCASQWLANTEQFRHEALIQFLDNAFLLKGPPAHGINIADGIGYVVKSLNIGPPDPDRPIGILMFSEGTPYLPAFGFVQQLSIMDMSEKATLDTPPLTPIEIHTQFLDALDKEVRETIQASGATEMTVDSAVRGLQKRVTHLIAGGSNTIGPCGLIPLYHTADPDMLLPGERQAAYMGEMIDIDEWRLNPRLRYPSTTKAYHLTHDQFNAAREQKLKRYVGDVTPAARSLPHDVPRSIATFDALFELAEVALRHQIYVVTEHLGSHPMWKLAFMSDDWDKVSAFMAIVKERDHLIKVYDNETQTVIGRPPKEEHDDQL